MSYYYRKPPNPLETLLMGRRNVFVQNPSGGYVLLSATELIVSLYFFRLSIREEPYASARLELPGDLFDGQGWNMQAIRDLLEQIVV